MELTRNDKNMIKNDKNTKKNNLMGDTFIQWRKLKKTIRNFLKVWSKDELANIYIKRNSIIIYDKT